MCLNSFLKVWIFKAGTFLGTIWFHCQHTSKWLKIYCPFHKAEKSLKDYENLNSISSDQMFEEQEVGKSQNPRCDIYFLKHVLWTALGAKSNSECLISPF